MLVLLDSQYLTQYNQNIPSMLTCLGISCWPIPPTIISAVFMTLPTFYENICAIADTNLEVS
ncbi:hypothetical protein FACS189493_6170 [Spirochaetia bacterium]|nr:hypothetical protein FACS189493_6170 [Spirochaetia bacterium]